MKNLHDNKVTFKVNLEKGIELIEDVNSDGKINAIDADLLSKYITNFAILYILYYKESYIKQN